MIQRHLRLRVKRATSPALLLPAASPYPPMALMFPLHQQGEGFEAVALCVILRVPYCTRAGQERALPMQEARVAPTNVLPKEPL